MVSGNLANASFDVKASIIIIFNVHMTPIIGGGNSMTAVPLLKVLVKQEVQIVLCVNICYFKVRGLILFSDSFIQL